MLTKTKSSGRGAALFLAAALLGLPALAHAAKAAPLDLEDCDVLLGAKDAARFHALSQSVEAGAARGEFEALWQRAAIANNRFACIEEARTGDSGWSVVVEQKSKSGEPQATEQVDRPVIRGIEKDAEALAALKQAQAAAQALAERDLGLRLMAAEFVSRYPQALQSGRAQAYLDAAGVYEVDCLNPGRVPKRDSRTACIGTRGTKAILTRYVDAAQREQLDRQAHDWAQQFLAGLGKPAKP